MRASVLVCVCERVCACVCVRVFVLCIPRFVWVHTHLSMNKRKRSHNKMSVVECVWARVLVCASAELCGFILVVRDVGSY